MLTYFPMLVHSQGQLGVAYSLVTGAEPMILPLPALVGQVQVVRRGGWHRLGSDGRRDTPYAVGIAGPTSIATLLHVEPNTWSIGVGLPPAGWGRAIGCSAALLANRVVDAGSVWGDGAVRTLLARLDDIDDPARATAILSSFVAERISAAPSCDPRLPGIERWLSIAGVRSLDWLAGNLSLSHRQTARLTGQLFGFSPKALQMKYRALRLSVDLGLGRTAGEDAMQDSADAYYDQSHLIREFRRFIGLTPRAFAEERASFAHAMLLGRWRAGARSPTTLWS